MKKNTENFTYTEGMYTQNNVYSLEAMLDNQLEGHILPAQNEDYSSVGVENFLHKLSYREHVVLLLRFFEIPNEQIGDILHIHPSGIYPILRGIRRKTAQGL